MVKIHPRFLGGEANVVGTKFNHLAAGTKAREGQKWVCTAGDEQVHLGRCISEQKIYGLMNCRGRNNLIIVENKGEVVFNGVDFIH